MPSVINVWLIVSVLIRLSLVLLAIRCDSKFYSNLRSRKEEEEERKRLLEIEEEKRRVQQEIEDEKRRIKEQREERERQIEAEIQAEEEKARALYGQSVVLFFLQ